MCFSLCLSQQSEEGQPSSHVVVSWCPESVPSCIVFPPPPAASISCFTGVIVYVCFALKGKERKANGGDTPSTSAQLELRHSGSPASKEEAEHSILASYVSFANHTSSSLEGTLDIKYIITF